MRVQSVYSCHRRRSEASRRTFSSFWKQNPNKIFVRVWTLGQFSGVKLRENKINDTIFFYFFFKGQGSKIFLIFILLVNYIFIVKVKLILSLPLLISPYIPFIWRKVLNQFELTRFQLKLSDFLFSIQIRPTKPNESLPN